MRMVFYFILICICPSCQEVQTIDSQSVAPHLISDKSVEYTSEEIENLKKAEGLKTDIFNESVLAQHSLSEKTYVYNITKIENEEFLIQTLKLEKMQEKFEDSFELVHLFFFENQNEELNFYIRKNNLAGSAFIISESSFLEKEANWQGEFPAVWMKNENEGINMIYEQKFSKEELLTILQIVTL